jgi:50S ribosomal subunit-associated GTPase HflX
MVNYRGGESVKQCMVIGQTNAGKTAFVLSFAEFLGVEKIEVAFLYPDGFSTKQAYALGIARSELVGPASHKTRCLQSIRVSVKRGKGSAVVDLVDSTGFQAGVPGEVDVRRGISQTLQRMRTAHLIMHVIDAAALGRREHSGNVLSEIDQQVVAYSQGRSAYALIASKMDLPTAPAGLLRLRTLYPGVLILPVSSVQKSGMREVKSFVGRHL